jgi:hypothetical protein
VRGARAALGGCLETRDPPAYILVGTGDTNRFEPLDSRTQLERFPAFRGLVAREYETETKIGAFVVLRRRAFTAGATP